MNYKLTEKAKIELLNGQASWVDKESVKPGLAGEVHCLANYDSIRVELAKDGIKVVFLFKNEDISYLEHFCILGGGDTVTVHNLAGKMPLVMSGGTSEKDPQEKPPSVIVRFFRWIFMED